MKTFSFTLLTDNKYTLDVGVVDVGEPTIISGLLVERAQAIPETSSTISLLILGVLGVFPAFKHIQKSRY
ncbi:hypothetical protein [Nostoc sp. DedQUE09]|uniref:hypothetical protein n=1 Tax=Nostoc sp. DedQUE09 TaxID=3075394 RepID=UPI002AD40269|nr:hypothetical protein [Nostoc sp. DedQUE09]MDZ7954416.1 hypothetical protein [Nostoc sp. DedQUE09]